MQPGNGSSPPSRLADATGTVHEPAGDDARIVCLVPSITELLCDLGLSEQLVGRTGFCIHPREIVQTIPKVGGTKDVKLDRIQRLAPTHVILNIEENRRATAEALADFDAQIIVTTPKARAITSISTGCSEASSAETSRPSASVTPSRTSTLGYRRQRDRRETCCT